MRILSKFELELRQEFEMARTEGHPFCIIVLEKPIKEMKYLFVGRDVSSKDVASMVDNLLHNDHCKQRYTFLAVFDADMDFGDQWIGRTRVEKAEDLVANPFITETLVRDLHAETKKRAEKLPKGPRPIAP